MLLRLVLFTLWRRALVGRVVVRRVNQTQFERLVIATLASINLLR